MSLMLAAFVSVSAAAQTAETTATHRYLSCSTVEMPNGNTMIIDRLPYLVFDTGSASITPQGAATLDGFIDGYDAPSYCQMVVEGHADRVGSAVRNLQLSRRRAEAVAAYLRRKGVTAPIVVNFHGETRPLVDTPDEIPERQNRYVSIWINDPRPAPR